jgi:hypothetical protein
VEWVVTSLISQIESLTGFRVLVSHGYLNMARESASVLLSD